MDELVPDTAVNNADPVQAGTGAGEPAPRSSLQQYLKTVKECIAAEINKHGEPICYQQGSFFDRPMHPVFAMRKDISTIGLTASTLYQQDVFVWLPHLVPGHPDYFKCNCGQALSSHGMSFPIVY